MTPLSPDLVIREGPSGWARRLAAGHPIEPSALAGASYRGTSLGLPRAIERLTWTTFRKVFLAEGDRVRGWNVRVEQTPPHRARERAGAPWTFGHFEVVRARGDESPLPVATGGVLLDYGRGGNARLDPIGLVRDPVVALIPGSVDLLLGWTYARVLGRSVRTPSWFLLEREGDLDHRAVPPRPG